MLGGDPKSPGRKTIMGKYRLKNSSESDKKYKEYLAWLKASRIKAGKIEKEYRSAIKALGDEIARRDRKYLAEDIKLEKKLKKGRV